MNKIAILPDNIINQIAAGEVVENPSSIVKELIENSIDSGATDITISVKKGGHELIHISDNGCGMNNEDLNLAFSRHATSKISKIDDLTQIGTLGFRGEALPSIASVSRVEIKSSIDGQLGYIINIEGGNIKNNEKTGSNKGTEIKVKNLFYNTPARKKFLKSSTQELRRITKIVKRFLLSNPNISFIYKSDDKVIYNVHSVSLKDRIVQVFGSSYNKDVLNVESKDGQYAISGYIGSLNLLQRRRGGQYLFLNGRYIEDDSISKSIRNCYDSTVQRGEFPFYVLFINLPTDTFDINVHPTKIEARFSKKLDILNFINNSIKNKLRDLFKVLPDIDIKSKMHKGSDPLSLDLDLNMLIDLKSEDNITQKFSSNNLKDNKEDQDVVERAVDRLENYENNFKSLIKKDAHVWQIHNKYLITEITSGILVIDQHVAHERVLYEKVKKAFDSKPLPSQSTLFPKTIKFDPEDFTRFLDIVPYLEKIGYKMREFGDNTIIIEGIPSEIKLGNEEEVINDILDRYIEYKKISSSYIDYIAATYSCKAAVKAGDYLDMEERVNLIDNLFATKNPYYCPHGRPIVVSIKTDELDKRFERK
tara:strand:- start:4960 stop:6735 length:1776 start_codon:yes stop_codon:yes gene_type:complete